MQLLAQINLISIDDQVIDAAIQMRRNFGGKTVDTIIAATAANLRLPLLTRDRDFLRFRSEIEVIGVS